MLWQVRALLEDRPGAMAALAVSCGKQSVNILGMQVFPAADGRVVDELVLHTPGGWAAEDVEQLCVLAGVDDPMVAECSQRALEDQPVRYLRAAQVVMEDPGQLEDQLCRLLDAFPADGLPGLDSLVLDDVYGPPVRLSRRVPFTDTELARALELRRLAAAVLGTDPDPALLSPKATAAAEPVGAGAATMRLGTAQDVDALIAMHARCSAATTYRRYHAPVPHISARLARSLLEPVGGVSMVVTTGEDVVAVGMFAPDMAGAELGLMVEDGWQRKGYGTKLLRALATIRRAGLRARVTFDDGATRYRIPVQALRGTAPLVALLHERRELREVYPPADLIDQAVRDGA